MAMRNGLVGLNAQLKTRREWPSKSPTVEPESHLKIQNILKMKKRVRQSDVEKMEAHLHILVHFSNQILGACKLKFKHYDLMLLYTL